MWLPRTVEIAQRLWLEGQSANQIVAALKAERVSVTRNAVIGKLYRLGLTSKSRQNAGQEATRVRNLMASRGKERVAATNQAKGALARRRNEHTKPAPVPAPVNDPTLPVASPHARRWQDRANGECKWPIGERGAIHSCCNPITRGQYCAGHAAKAYTGTTSAQELARSLRRYA